MAHNHPSEHHVTPLSVYLKVFGALLVLTVITVAVAPVGPLHIKSAFWSTIIAMFIATIKASLVLLFFMHMKYDNNMNRVIFATGFFFLLVLFAFSAFDVYTRFNSLPM